MRKQSQKTGTLSIITEGKGLVEGPASLQGIPTERETLTSRQ